MKVKFELNGKGLLAIALLSASITFANFVSFVDADSAGGIVIEKETMTVGAVVLRLDDVNPSTIYGGTWQLITGDASLRLGNGNIQSGNVIAGDNDPVVPLPAHSHDMDHDHPIATTNTDTHSHTYSTYRAFDASHTPSGNGHRIGVGSGTTPSYSNRSGGVNSDSHNHTLDLPNYIGKTSSDGVANPTLDVRGSYLTVNVWKRIN